MATIRQQTLQPDFFVAIDSGSDDGTAEMLREAGATIHIIRREEFNHGGTRQMAVEMYPEADIVIFLTQDAIPSHPRTLENLTACFEDDSVGAAYGRQLPRPGASPIESHARHFNYPPEDIVKSIDDAPRFGIKTAYISNSFAAYRRSALLEAGGFPGNVIGTEDTYVTAKMLLNGWKVHYCGAATVYHSHAYGFLAEFRRYYDIGYFYGKESWIGRSFAGALDEGKRFVFSELRYLADRNILLIPSALLRTALKICAYRLGNRAERHPLWVRRACSMNRNYWMSGHIDKDKMHLHRTTDGKLC